MPRQSFGDEDSNRNRGGQYRGDDRDRERPRAQGANFSGLGSSQRDSSRQDEEYRNTDRQYGQQQYGQGNSQNSSQSSGERDSAFGRDSEEGWAHAGESSQGYPRMDYSRDNSRDFSRGDPRNSSANYFGDYSGSESQGYGQGFGSDDSDQRYFGTRSESRDNQDYGGWLDRGERYRSQSYGRQGNQGSNQYANQSRGYENEQRGNYGDRWSRNQGQGDEGNRVGFRSGAEQRFDRGGRSSGSYPGGRNYGSSRYGGSEYERSDYGNNESELGAGPYGRTYGSQSSAEVVGNRWSQTRGSGEWNSGPDQAQGPNYGQYGRGGEDVRSNQYRSDNQYSGNRSGQNQNYGQSFGGGYGQSYGQSFNRQSYGDTHQGKGPKGYARSDERLKEIICERLTDAPHIDATHIDVEVKNGEVTLTGTVDDRNSKFAAESLIAGSGGVKEVHNQLRVKGNFGQESESTSQSVKASPTQGNQSVTQTSGNRQLGGANDQANRSSMTGGSSSGAASQSAQGQSSAQSSSQSTGQNNGHAGLGSQGTQSGGSQTEATKGEKGSDKKSKS